MPRREIRIPRRGIAVSRRGIAISRRGTDLGVVQLQVYSSLNRFYIACA